MNPQDNNTYGGASAPSFRPDGAPPPYGQPQGGFSPPPVGFGGGYPPSSGQTKDGYPPAQVGGYEPPTHGGGYPPPKDGGYAPPQSGGYAPPQPGGYAPPQPGGYAPMQPGGYAPPQPGGYGSPPQGGYAPPPQQGYAGGFGGYNPGMQQPGGYQPGPLQPYAPAPITVQPGLDGGWMNIPPGALPNCPPGLEYLTTISSLFVKQKVELLEAFTGFETNNKYTIKNDAGQKVFFAAEETDCCTRNCCGPMRPFDMKILDAQKNQVIHLYRPLRCSSCCFPCCLQTMEIYSPPGTQVGTIEQEWSILTPQFSIKNHMGETVLRIEGPICRYALCGPVEFKLLTLDGDQVGKISKEWSGFARELFTDADFFGIEFPGDLDVRMKAVMLGACFLIDMMFFEKAGHSENDGPGML